jgi:hypothetical protein
LKAYDLKEKHGLRSYGVAKKKTPVFLEIKKKYDRVVSKRRIITTQSGAKCFLNKTLRTKPSDSK